MLRPTAVSLGALALILSACSPQRWAEINSRTVPLTSDERLICEMLNLDHREIEYLRARPLHTFTPEEVDMYLRFVRRAIPDLRERVVHLGRKNIGQPYDIYLLGEFPYEVHDSEPTFDLTHSDCVVFSEHTYAMALGHDWRSFYETLQDIRYMDGEVGILTRNHWTLPVWNSSNRWLVEDLTEQLGGGGQWSALHQTVKPSIFFMRRFGLGADIPDADYTHTYIPLDNIENVLPDLRDGDWVNVIRGTPDAGWAGHTGLIAIGEDGAVNFLHSSRPRVREEPVMSYVARAIARNERYAESPPEDWTYHPTIGLKFLRLRADELSVRFTVSDGDLVLPVPDRDFRRPPEED